MHLTSASFLELLATLLHLGLALGVSAHIVLNKQDVRAAIGWVGLVWLTPLVGSVLYLGFGINRIRRQAARRRRPGTGRTDQLAVARPPLPEACPAPLTGQARLVGAATGLELTAGNAVEMLVNGDVAYPAMLEAIERADRSVALASYIFDRGQVGDRFVEALARAAARGVEVRVLIDAVGERYGRPPVGRILRDRGVPTATFLPPTIPIIHPYLNLRNHRKLLVVDGQVGFCGGMNIRDGCLLALDLPSATRDLHFRVRGPVVRQLFQIFTVDWAFTTGEDLAGPAWALALEPVGDIPARAIPDGPDEDFETLFVALLGALTQARERIRIVTPYFLPDPPLMDALRVAALRGVRVEIVLPQRGNLRLVEWAAFAQLPHLLRWGCEVHLSRPPFDHSKLLTVDGQWCLVGSANWDPRSLRLNFEFGLECYSERLAAELDGLVDRLIADGRRLTLSGLLGRGLARRLRDGLVWLAQPYL